MGKGNFGGGGCQTTIRTVSVSHEDRTGIATRRVRLLLVVASFDEVMATCLKEKYKSGRREWDFRVPYTTKTVAEHLWEKLPSWWIPQTIGVWLLHICILSWERVTTIGRISYERSFLKKMMHCDFHIQKESPAWIMLSKKKVNKTTCNAPILFIIT